jgi:FkbM family methyltransferase
MVVETVHPKMLNHYKRFQHLKDKYNYSPELILDIGALDGRWTATINKIFTKSKFIMIEPNKEMEPYLEKIGSEFHIKSLSDQSKICKYYKLPGHAGNSLYQEKGNITEVYEEIQTTTLNKLFDENQIFNLIKLDVQGSELDILLGGQNFLINTDLILMECSVIEYNIGAPSFYEQINFLKENNFDFFDVVDLLYDKNEKLIQMDILFKNNNFSFKK